MLLWLFLFCSWDAREGLRVQLSTAASAALVSLWYYTENQTSKADWPQRKHTCLERRRGVILSQVPSQYYKGAGPALIGCSKLGDSQALGVWLTLLIYSPLVLW